jgi:hypothetical protein
MPFPLNEMALWVRNVDVLWFRWLSVATSLGGIGYKVLFPHETPLRLVVAWNIVFILINVAHIVILLQERREVEFSGEEQELYQTLFPGFSPVEFMKLMRLAHWTSGEAGAVLTQQGEPVTHLVLLYNGEAEVEIDGESVARLRDGAFIGEMSLVTKNPATATVRLCASTRYLRWSKDDLQALLERNPHMSHAMQSVVAADLTKKLMTR